MSATFATETESQSTEKTVEPGDEAKMEPASEQPQTEQPSSVMPPAETTVGQEVAEVAERPPSPQDQDPARLTSCLPGDSSNLAPASLEGSSVDEPPLVDLSDNSDVGANIQSGDRNALAGSSCAPLKESVNGKTEVGEKSEHIEKVDRLTNLAQQIDDFDPVSLFDGSEIVSDHDKGLKTEECSLFSKDINDETLIDDLIKDAADGGFESDKLVEHEREIDETDSNLNTGKMDDDEDASGCGLDKVDASKSEGHDIADEIINQDIDDIKEFGVCEQPDSQVSVSAAEDTDKVNGTMTASTESEGLNEEQKQEEPGESKETKSASEQTSENKEPETSSKKKTESVKTETASPTKVVKSKRKEDKSIEHILKALSSLQTTEEKLAALCKKYADLHEEHRVLQASFKQSQRKLAVVSREKDQLQTEHTKAVMAKSKLESLCRELQKHNQTIRQESIQRAKEEDEKRKEISQKFQTTISEIQQQMQENHDRNKQLREENYELANKLKKFIEQYEAREKQVEKVIQHRELEQKLADAKLEQASAVLMEEKGKNQKEKEILLLQSTEFMKKLQLKDAELQMYKERYEEFQSTISKSEEMFQKFKTEMEKMTKRTKKLEKDGAQWKVKWENANRALLEMAEEKTKYDKEKSVLLNKISKLESLCRAMQAERQARKMLDTDTVDASNLEKMSNLIPPEVRQTPVGSGSLSGAGDKESKMSTENPSTSGDTPDIEPGPSEPSPNCTELENNTAEDSEDSGDTELTDATVIPKEQTKDIAQHDTESKKNSDQSESQVPGEPPEKELEQNLSTNQDGDQTAQDEAVADNQSAS